MTEVCIVLEEQYFRTEPFSFITVIFKALGGAAGFYILSRTGMASYFNIRSPDLVYVVTIRVNQPLVHKINQVQVRHFTGLV